MSDLAAKKKTKTKAEEVQNEKEMTEETAETTAETTEGEAPGDSEAAETAEETVKDKTQEKIDELEDKVKRQLAEFENFRKRTEKEKATMFEAGAKSVIEKILPRVLCKFLAEVPAAVAEFFGSFR